MLTVSPKTIREMTEKIDPDNLVRIAFNLYEQIDRTVEMSKRWEIPQIRPKNIVMIGMGGSATGGYLIRDYAADKINVPILVSRDYDIPSFIGPDTLCIASSYSGNTEETLSAYKECVARNAAVIAVSTGGKLEEMAKKDNVAFCKIPDGLYPRAALGYSLSSIFMILSKAGILKKDENDLLGASAFLKSIKEKWENWNDQKDNPPLDLAVKIKGKLPVIYSSKGSLEAMAYRWKCQFNENSKMFASWASFPELNHNEVVGWGADPELLKNMHVIILRDPDESKRYTQLVGLTKKLLEKTTAVSDVFAEGKNDLEKLFHFIIFGDLLTIYTAYLSGKDPAEIDAIHWLKKELKAIS